jgi:hypothetical protein
MFPETCRLDTLSLALRLHLDKLGATLGDHNIEKIGCRVIAEDDLSE